MNAWTACIAFKWFIIISGCQTTKAFKIPKFFFFHLGIFGCHTEPTAIVGRQLFDSRPFNSRMHVKLTMCLMEMKYRRLRAWENCVLFEWKNAGNSTGRLAGSSLSSPWDRKIRNQNHIKDWKTFIGSQENIWSTCRVLKKCITRKYKQYFMTTKSHQVYVEP